MSFSPIDNLPAAPQRGDAPETFADNADTFLAALVDFQTQLNTFISELETAAALIAAAPAYADPGLVALTGNTPAADRLVYYTGASTSALATLTSVARTLLAQTSQANMRTTGLGLTSDGSALVTAADYAAMRTLLGLVIGTNVQAYDAELAALAGLTSAANKIPRFTGAGTADLIDFKDEDNMASDSATAVPSQQSVKAFVNAMQAATGGTAASGYLDIPATGLGTIRINWGSQSVAGNTSTLASLAGSYTTAIVGVVGWETSDTTLTDFSTGYLASTSQMRLTNGSSGSLTAQWIALGVV